MENGHEPASKQDIELLRSEGRSEIGQLRSEFEQVRSEFHHEFDELKETIRDSQTEILRAFYGYTQTTDAKLKEGEQSDMALRQRLTAVESRILEVEKRLNMPPAA